MRCLVTGGAGFIGSHLCDALVARNWPVCCVDNLLLGRVEHIAHLQGTPGFQFLEMDVLDQTRTDELFRAGHFEAVFHLAANSDIQNGNRDHEVDLRYTFMTTVAVLEAMAKHAVPRIFFASSSAVFGEAAQTLHEDFGPLRPISFYGASKVAAEAYISVYVNNYRLQASILRFPNVVGERTTHGALHDFMARLRLDPTKLTVLGDGRQAKPYLYVHDLVRAILLVFDEAHEPLSVYHVGGRDSTSVREIAAIVIEEMGLPNVTIEFTGGDRGWIGDVPHFTYDCRRIAALGFEPRYGSTEAVRVAVRRMLGKA